MMAHINMLTVLGVSWILGELNRPFAVLTRSTWNTALLLLRLLEFEHRLHRKRIFYHVVHRYVLSLRGRER